MYLIKKIKVHKNKFVGFTSKKKNEFKVSFPLFDVVVKLPGPLDVVGSRIC